MRWIRMLRRLAVLLLLGLGVVIALLFASRPIREGTLALPGLVSPAEIRFDARARPAVKAETLGDALFVEGFLHARERLWQMELLRRAGGGRLAEALGAGMLDTDREIWRSGVPALAARLEAGVSATTRSRVQRYVEGVNAGIESLPVRPPELLLAGIELRPFTSRDVFAVGALMAFDSSRNADLELLRFALAGLLSAEEMSAFLPDPSAPPIPPAAAEARAALRTLARRDALDATTKALLPNSSLGSNGWCVARDRSASGHALFAFDSHDALSMPNLFYEVHLFFENGRSLRGWSTPGMPGVINGFNERIAWGLTNIGDTQDLFLETHDGGAPGRFRVGDQWIDARTETVEIPVRGRSTPERLVITHAPHGPLIQDDPPIALAWTAHQLEAPGLDALFELGLATDWPSAHAALDRFAAPAANVNYADVDGRIVLRTVGRLPVRGRGEGLFPQRGDDPTTRWRAIVPAAEMPEVVDPERGFVAAANARVPSSGKAPLVSADNAPGYRIQRITDVLASSHTHTPDSMRALQVDWKNIQAAWMLPALLPALGALDPDTVHGAARDLVQRWAADPQSAPALGAPLIFERWYVGLARELFATRLGDPLWSRVLRETYLLNDAVDRLILGDPNAVWWRQERDALVQRAFREAVDQIARELGADPLRWRWDAGHVIRFEHELARAVPLLERVLSRGPYPWGGGSATVGRARERHDRPGIARYGATVRAVAELSFPMRVQAVIAGGESGHPLDEHYADQIPLWLRGEQETLPATFDEARGSRLRLEPAGSAPRGKADR